MTCGARQFRTAFAEAACRHAGIAFKATRFLTLERIPIGPTLRELPSSNQLVAAKAACEALARLDPGESTLDYAGIRLLLIELSSATSTVQVGKWLGRSWAGRYLQYMRLHYASVVRQAEERARYESAEATAARRQEKARARQQAHARLLEVATKRGDEREHFLASFAEHSPIDRLLMIAEGNLPLSLDAIPPDLLPPDSAAIEALTPEQRTSIVKAIGRRRRGWGRLRRALIDVP